MVSLENADLIEQSVLAILMKIDEILEDEPVSPKEDVTYINQCAERLYQIQSNLQQEWIHLGRLMKRMKDDTVA